ncbi:uncharacterized protein BJX67DRAFT_317030 [Aspergillus lucknowensis]|uniref:Uncharacterized protein n=1 Tax=Aspergillus lucknowensis TaxID=176173 RepID=A0ABR4L8Y3_9EURO
MAEQFASLVDSIGGLRLADTTTELSDSASRCADPTRIALIYAIQTLIQSAAATATQAQQVELSEEPTPLKASQSCSARQPNSTFSARRSKSTTSSPQLFIILTRKDSKSASRSTKRVVSRNALRRGKLLGASQDGNREFITLIAGICADYSRLPPALIYKGESNDMQETWLQDFDHSSEVAFFASTKSGWSCDALGLH